MESKAKLFGHAIHPILIVYPLGLLSTGVIFVLIYLVTANPTWATVSPEAPSTVALALSFIGVGAAMLGGWLGGELVERLGVGVAENAHLNAPNSLTHPDRNDVRIREEHPRHA